MLILKKYKQKVSDKFGVSIMKRAQKIEAVKKRKDVDFKLLYTSNLSENYKFPKRVVSEMLDINGLKVEAISRKNDTIKYALIQLHGGAYIFGYNDTYRKAAYEYLKGKAHMKVFSPIYSLAPRKPYPYALNEVVMVYKYLLEIGFDSKNIIIAGDSAGGGLAIAMTLYLRDQGVPLPRALITMSAWTNLAMNGESHTKNFKVDPMFGEGTQPLNVRAYAGKNDVTIPYISPKYGDFTQFTDMLMFVGGNEIIESDTLDVAKKAKETNEVQVHDFEGMFHVFPFGFNMMASSKTAWKIIKNYMNTILRDDEA